MFKNNLPKMKVKKKLPILIIPNSPSSPRVYDHEGIFNCHMNEIIPNLFLGNMYYSSDDLINNGIYHIINLSCDENNFSNQNSKFTFYNKKLNDTPNQNIIIHFEELFNIIEKILIQNKKILIHCEAGISRSSTIVIAYLMKTKKMGYEKSLEFVREKRPIVDPNLGFIVQLMDYEKKIFKK